MTKQVIKAPSSTLDIGVVWTKWLNAGDRITNSEWFANSAEITISQSTNDNNSTRTLISGGTLGKTYNVTNRITTESGLVDERFIQVFIQVQGAV